MSSKGKKIVVVAHDAGAAEVIAAYVRTHQAGGTYYCYVAGPAKRIFLRNKVRTLSAPRNVSGMKKLMQKYARASFALLGTGWMTKIERNALAAAKRADIKTVVYLDSWIGYREVFGYPKVGWRENLPDEFWAGDVAALKMARSYFPDSKIRLVPNRYFADILARYRRARKRGDSYVLYVSAAGKISRKFLEDFLSEAERVKSHISIRVRLHPADSKQLYKRILKRYPRSRAKISKGKNLVQDLLGARAVVGPETVALVPPSLLGIPAVRIVPKGEKAFLPFKAIKKVRSARPVLHAKNSKR